MDLEFEKETNTGCLLRSLALFKGEKRDWQQQINPILQKGGEFQRPFRNNKTLTVCLSVRQVAVKRGVSSR